MFCLLARVRGAFKAYYPTLAMRRFLAATLLLAAACGPTEGEVYEETLTGKRVEVGKSGKGREVYDYYHDVDSLIGAVQMMEPVARFGMIAQPRISNDALEVPSVAVIYMDEVQAPGGGAWEYQGRTVDAVPMKVADIIPAHKFKQKYQKVE